MFREFSLVLFYYSSFFLVLFSMHIFWILSCDIYATYIDLQISACTNDDHISIYMYTISV